MHPGESYDSHMKARTTITLEVETLRALDAYAGPGGNRSQVMEQAVQEYLARAERERREARDREILDRTADELNREVEEVLDL